MEYNTIKDAHKRKLCTPNIHLQIKVECFSLPRVLSGSHLKFQTGRLPQNPLSLLNLFVLTQADGSVFKNIQRKKERQKEKREKTHLPVSWSYDPSSSLESDRLWSRFFAFIFPRGAPERGTVGNQLLRVLAVLPHKVASDSNVVVVVRLPAACLR